MKPITTEADKVFCNEFKKQKKYAYPQCIRVLDLSIIVYARDQINSLMSCIRRWAMLLAVVAKLLSA
jgi:hypothetical protein